MNPQKKHEHVSVTLFPYVCVCMGVGVGWGRCHHFFQKLDTVITFQVSVSITLANTKLIITKQTADNVGNTRIHGNIIQFSVVIIFTYH
jgi:hypothetical protein